MTTAMGAELVAATEEGRALVAVAEACAASFVEGAVARDRDGRFADDHLAQLRAVGYLKGPIPVELGGGGVSSTRDVLVAASRLARGDPSTAIGVNMHFAVVLNIVRHWRIATTRTEVERADALATMLRRIAEGDVVLAAAASEPAPQNLTRPSTTAQRAGDGWVVHGQKSFATMAPAATMLNVAVTYQDDDGVEHYGFAMIPTAAAGVELHDDWDALGMRASASGSVSFHGVRLERGQVHDGFPVGTFSVEFHDRYLTSGALNASASLGIAEAAHDHVLGRLRGRPDAVLDDPHATMRLADNMVDLATMRAVFDRAGRLIDDFHAAFPTGAFALQDIQTVFGEVQAAKLHVHDAACRVVDRALALRGGGGYLTASPLAKAWRDVRAGAFMHPLGDNRAYAYLATTALGVPPPSR